MHSSTRRVVGVKRIVVAYPEKELVLKGTRDLYILGVVASTGRKEEFTTKGTKTPSHSSTTLPHWIRTAFRYRLLAVLSSRRVSTVLYFWATRFQHWVAPQMKVKVNECEPSQRRCLLKQVSWSPESNRDSSPSQSHPQELTCKLLTLALLSRSHIIILKF